MFYHIRNKTKAEVPIHFGNSAVSQKLKGLRPLDPFVSAPPSGMV